MASGKLRASVAEGCSVFLSLKFELMQALQLHYANQSNNLFMFGLHSLVLYVTLDIFFCTMFFPSHSTTYNGISDCAKNRQFFQFREGVEKAIGMYLFICKM